MRRKILAIVMFAVSGLAQTQVDLPTQTRRVDFSGSSTTRPVKTGTVLPQTCSVGEMYFKSDAAAGQNLYGCTGSNVWSQLSGGAGTFGAQSAGLAFVSPLAGAAGIPGWGKVGASHLGIWDVALNGAVATFGSACVTGSPCRVGGYAINGPVACTINASGGGTDNAYVYINLTNGHLTVGSTGLTTDGCGGAADVATGVTAFPPKSVPLYLISTVGTNWSTATDMRSFLNGQYWVDGTGIVTSYSGTVPTIGLSNAVAMVGTNNTFSGDQTFTGKVIAVGATRTQPFRVGTGTASGTCAIGDTYFQSDAAAGQNLWVCPAANTWTQVGVSATFDYSAWRFVETWASNKNGVAGDHGWLNKEPGTGASYDSAAVVTGSGIHGGVRIKPADGGAGEIFLRGIATSGTDTGWELAGRKWRVDMLFQPVAGYASMIYRLGFTSLIDPASAGAPDGLFGTGSGYNVWLESDAGNSPTGWVVKHAYNGTAATDCTTTTQADGTKGHRLSWVSDGTNVTVHLYAGGTDVFASGCTVAMGTGAVPLGTGFTPVVLVETRSGGGSGKTAIVSMVTAELQ